MLDSSHIVAFAAATDLHRARAFYEQVLGLSVAEHNDFACVIDANGTMLRITAVPEVCRAGYTILGWRVTDIGAVVRELAARGVVFLRYDGMDQDAEGRARSAICAPPLRVDLLILAEAERLVT